MPPRPAAIAALLALLAVAPGGAAADGLTLTVLTERTGPAAAAGAQLANGLADYLTMLDRRDGGVGGITLTVEECETGGEVARALACHAAAVARGSVAVVPGSADAALALLPRLAAGRVPLVASGYGPAAMARGDALPWAFAPPVTVWDGLAAALAHLSQDGSEGNPQGRSLAYLHRDSPAGREPVPVLQALAAEAGLEFRAYALPDGAAAPDADPWRRARAADPDTVILDATAGLSGAPLRDAAAAGFPLNRVVTMGWTGEDDLLRPAGGARDLTAKGLRIVTWHALTDSFPAFDQIDLLVVDAGLSRTPKEESAGPLYNRGVYAGVVLAEGIRNAQALAGRKRIDGAEMRRGLEAINLDPVRWKELGLVGFARRLRLTCADHSGRRPVTVQEWTGARWVQVGDEIPAPRERLSAPLDAAVAAQAERAASGTGSAVTQPREPCPARP
ncbi:ABC transporter substrate-binding protein [Methylobacterium platani]|uniref:Branched-chain amino acid ABC transporter substrate-binding protein n=2 Tax=Methylobacterium platani TaxID=427683 RepID=A0A179SKC3_9HYPH|nr:ABC transporter substrate-binding protein [Methylobacterium platani]KMO11615.1 branched-chain amino acid ABC transporter substrate-binding protein [Methylobacterium platani JCM 14648]OAS27004.1 branched-chain amino acid ABC transporter substrate-binding protein [Methylobacterium platani]